MNVTIDTWGGPRIKKWKDKETLLESCIPDIFLELLLMAEEALRGNAQASYQWHVEDREHRRKERLKQEAEASAKHEREQIEWEKKKVERLVQQAHNLRISDDIRNMVQTIGVGGIIRAAQADWMNWALQEAAKIDPRTNGSLEQDMLEWQK
jgi:hypothetical protein